jgi:hypothetical protein
MVKKFFTAIVSEQKHRVFLDDLKQIIKRSKNIRPQIPAFLKETNASQKAISCFPNEKDD